jgi:hypothetical protein
VERIKFMTCPEHNKEQVWIELSPGRKVLRCPNCHAGVKPVSEKKTPHIKYAQNFHRERPWTDLEKKAQFGKARKPKF